MAVYASFETYFCFIICILYKTTYKLNFLIWVCSLFHFCHLEKFGNHLWVWYDIEKVLKNEYWIVIMKPNKYFEVCFKILLQWIRVSLDSKLIFLGFCRAGNRFQSCQASPKLTPIMKFLDHSHMVWKLLFRKFRLGLRWDIAIECGRYNIAITFIIVRYVRSDGHIMPVGFNNFLGKLKLERKEINFCKTISSILFTILEFLFANLTEIIQNYLVSNDNFDLINRRVSFLLESISVGFDWISRHNWTSSSFLLYFPLYGQLIWYGK